MCLEVDRLGEDCEEQGRIINHKVPLIVREDFIQLLRKLKVHIKNAPDQLENTIILHENRPRVTVRKLDPEKPYS